MGTEDSSGYRRTLVGIGGLYWVHGRLYGSEDSNGYG